MALDLAPIRAKLNHTRRRLRVQAAIDMFAIVLGPAFPLGFAAVSVGRIDIALGIAAVAGVIVLASALRPRSDVAIAARLDRAGELADRIGTALALAPRQGDGGFVDAAIRDGIAASHRASPRDAVPYKIPTTFVVAFGLVGATAALAIAVPSYPRLHVAIEEPERTWDGTPASLYTYDELDFIFDQIDEARGHAPAIGPIACRLDDVLDKLASGSVDKETALLELTRAMHDAEAAGLPGVLDDVGESVRRLHARSSLPAAPAIQMPTQDVALDIANGRSKREVIVAAARRGFASIEYRQVYAQYRRHEYDVMHAAQMPASYRYYVAHYFEKISGGGEPRSCSDRPGDLD